MSGWRRVAVAALALLVLPGCAVTVAGTGYPARNGTVAALPFDEPERIFAEQMAVFRGWDVCAMHDVAAAERATGSLAFAVRPTRGLDGCEIALEAASDGRLAYVTVEVAEIVPGSGRDAEVSGRAFPAVAPVQGAEDRAECGYARPVALGWGVVVRGEIDGDPVASCTVAQTYLADILPRVDDPPQRSAAGTDPAFVLGSQDPCAALAAVVPDAADVTVPGPRTCAVVDGVSVAFGLAQFEVDVEGVASIVGGERLEVVDGGVANRAAGQDSRDTCAVTLQSGKATLLAPSLPYLYRESVSVSAPDCDTARAHATQIVSMLPPAATPAVGALPLGSLEDFPMAEDVGAPFDPCTTVGWSAYPADVRPPGIDPQAFPAPIDSGVLYRVGCDYTSDAVTSVVSWGPPNAGYSVDPAARTGVATEFGGRPGLEDRPAVAPGQAPLCLSTMQIGNGLAGVITQARASQVDLCAVNRGVLEALAPLVP